MRALGRSARIGLWSRRGLRRRRGCGLRLASVQGRLPACRLGSGREDRAGRWVREPGGGAGAVAAAAAEEVVAKVGAGAGSGTRRDERGGGGSGGDSGLAGDGARDGGRGGSGGGPGARRGATESRRRGGQRRVGTARAQLLTPAPGPRTLATRQRRPREPPRPGPGRVGRTSRCWVRGGARARAALRGRRGVRGSPGWGGASWRPAGSGKPKAGYGSRLKGPADLSEFAWWEILQCLPG